MSVYILRWNPAISSYKKRGHKNLIRNLEQGKMPLDFNWSIKEWENLKKDDFFILQQVGTDDDGIAMIGKFKGPCYEDISWKKDGSKIHYADMWIKEAFDCDKNNILPAKKYERLFPEIKWHGGHSGIEVDPKNAGNLIAAIEKDLIQAGIWDNESLNNFRNYNGPEVLDDDGPGRPTAEDLADGTILLQMKHEFMENKSQENFVSLVCCLHDSVMKVPVHIKISERSKESLNQSIQEGKEEFQVDDEVQYFPMTLVNDEGKSAMAIFSNEEEIGDHYAESEDMVFMDIPFVECAAFFKEADDCDLMVLDGFTEPFIMDREMAKMIAEIKYKDEESNPETEE